MSLPGPSRTVATLRPPSARWDPPHSLEADRVGALERSLRLPAPVCAILAARGLSDVDDAKRFLRPNLDQLADPGLLADGAKASARIADAIRNRETIFVHGDYDVDGICATALLTRWFRSLGGTVAPFVPHRVRDGYDFSPAGLDAAAEAGAGLVVTADCGTVAHDTIDRARALGIEVIVTDHHTVANTLPAALAVVNPQRPDCAYPFKGLCGTGLAYRLGELVARELKADPVPLSERLDLVALATVADLVPLGGENRVLVHFGLRRFADSRVAGVRALLDVSEVEPGTVTAGQVGFRIAPRINAVGRIGESADALRLLLTDDPDEARGLAGQLDATNARRRDEDRRTLDEALSMLSESYDPERDFGVVLAGDGWHPGVIGIVASRVVERIHRPVVMVARGEAMGRGSARSIPAFHLYEALAECRDRLERFGGHRQAAGMDVRLDGIDAFRDAFNRAARARLRPEDLMPVLRPDIDVTLADIDLQLVHWLDYLGPHGIGNPGPLLRATGVSLANARTVGSNHLKVTLRDGAASLDGIGFGLVDRYEPESLREGRWDVLFRLERNEWRGAVTVQAKIADLRAAESLPRA